MFENDFSIRVSGVPGRADCFAQKRSAMYGVRAEDGAERLDIPGVVRYETGWAAEIRGSLVCAAELRMNP